MFKPGGQAAFDKLLEKATSQFLLEPEWGSIMQICDLIRQKDCPPKYVVNCIKKKLYHQNPHVVMFGLQVMESVVKNCGSPIHDEVATKQFMEELRDLSKSTQHENVREKILELIQTWAHAFRKSPKYRAVQDIFNIMKTEGAKFPPLVEADAMFAADTAPEWADGECCHRCRVEFGLINRKHHCRACGQIFCGKCSSKMCPLPKFGIERDVRVCESCYDKYAKTSTPSRPHGIRADGSRGSMEDQLLNEALAASLAEAKAPSSKPTGAGGKTEEELQEEEQLQLALAISQSEAEAKEREKSRPLNNTSLANAYESPELAAATATVPDKRATSPDHMAASPVNEDPELSRYMNRSYWEQRQNEIKENGRKDEKGELKDLNKVQGGTYGTGMQFLPSAPMKESKDKGEVEEEIDAFNASLRSQLEMFVNRMKSCSSRGRPIANDSSVQGLFTHITCLHPQLLRYIEVQDNARLHFEQLQDKLSQLRDARAALDALREEHKDRLRIQAEEQERARQLQMAQKLHVMRQKKQEYLQYQRQIALQRMQEQEREMQLRIEQQKQAGIFPNPVPGQPQYQHPSYMGQQHPGYNMPPQQQPPPAPAPGGQPPPNYMYGHPQGTPMQQQQYNIPPTTGPHSQAPPIPHGGQYGPPSQFMNSIPPPHQPSGPPVGIPGQVPPPQQQQQQVLPGQPIPTGHVPPQSQQSDSHIGYTGQPQNYGPPPVTTTTYSALPQMPNVPQSPIQPPKEPEIAELISFD